MLPDFPVQKEKLLRFCNAYLERKRLEYLGYFAEAPSYTHHEGDRWSVQRENGTTMPSTYREFETVFSIPTDEIPCLTLDRILQKLDAVAEELAKDVRDYIIKGISEAIDEAGTRVDAKGGTLTRSLFLEVLDQMLLPFDEDGRVVPPAILMHPRAWQANREEMESWQQDPEFNRRYEEIVERKREVWRVRESRRKLAD